MHMELLPQAAAVMARLEAAGHTAEAVGGCVRDTLLGRAPHDWDVCTCAAPDVVQALFAELPQAPTGLAHGTVTLVPDGVPIEVTTYRTDGVYSDHRRPDDVRFSTHLADDLARRDFTVNAMAYSPVRGLTDLYGGQADLAAHCIRCVGDPNARFAEDALRILRALRFAAQLDFTLDAATDAAVRARRGDLAFVARERVFAELHRLVCGPGAGRVLAQYPDVLGAVIPEITPCVGFEQQSRYHNKDVWAHISAAVDAGVAGAAAPDATVQWALLLHDIGKPQCFSVGADGAGHFYGHGDASEAIARDVLRRLRAPTALRDDVCALVRWHDVPMEPSRRCAVRWLNRLGEQQLWRLLAVKRADMQAHAPNTVAPRLRETEAFAQCVRQALEDDACFSLKQLAVGGAEVLAAGCPHGAAVGRVLAALLQKVADGDVPNTRAALISAAAPLIAAEQQHLR